MPKFINWPFHRKAFSIWTVTTLKIGDGMGFLESLRDRELRGLYKARKLIESADLHLANGRMPEAKSDLVKAQEILFTDVSKESPHSKDYTDILSTMSGIQLKAELYDDSIRSADKALTISPNAIVAITMKAKALAAKGAYPDAIALLDKAISLNNNDHMLFLERERYFARQESSKKLFYH